MITLEEAMAALENMPESTRLERAQFHLSQLPRYIRVEIPRAITASYHRVRHGWAPRDTWNLDKHLCKVLGEMLAHLADNLHGWPESAGFETPEDWEKALREQSAKLLAWDWDADDDGTQGVKSLEGAQDALRWVADHLPDLWD